MLIAYLQDLLCYQQFDPCLVQTLLQSGGVLNPERCKFFKNVVNEATIDNPHQKQ